MRNKLVPLVLTWFGLFGPNNAAAQENWRLGIEATPSYFMMYNKTDWANDFQYPVGSDIFDVKGFAGGLRLSVDLNEYLGLASGIRYVFSRQDYKQATGDDSYSFYENYFTSNELQLPMQLTIGTSNHNDFRFYGSIGLGLNYRLSYIEKLAFTTKSPFDIYSVLNQYEDEIFQVRSTFEEGFEATIDIDRMYKDVTLSALIETGITRTFESGLGINIALQYQCGIVNPENRTAQFYDIPDGFAPRRLWHTIDGTKWRRDLVEEDVRPQTFPMHFGLLFGVYYQFGY
jgi:hypothetical protein